MHQFQLNFRNAAEVVAAEQAARAQAQAEAPPWQSGVQESIDAAAAQAAQAQAQGQQVQTWDILFPEQAARQPRQRRQTQEVEAPEAATPSSRRHWAETRQPRPFVPQNFEPEEPRPPPLRRKRRTEMQLTLDDVLQHDDDVIEIPKPEPEPESEPEGDPERMASLRDYGRVPTNPHNLEYKPPDDDVPTKINPHMTRRDARLLVENASRYPLNLEHPQIQHVMKLLQEAIDKTKAHEQEAASAPPAPEAAPEASPPEDPEDYITGREQLTELLHYYTLHYHNLEWQRQALKATEDNLPAIRQKMEEQVRALQAEVASLREQRRRETVPDNTGALDRRRGILEGQIEELTAGIQKQEQDHQAAVRRCQESERQLRDLRRLISRNIFRFLDLLATDDLKEQIRQTYLRQAERILGEDFGARRGEEARARVDKLLGPKRTSDLRYPTFDDRLAPDTEHFEERLQAHLLALRGTVSGTDTKNILEEMRQEFSSANYLLFVFRHYLWLYTRLRPDGPQFDRPGLLQQYKDTEGVILKGLRQQATVIGKVVIPLLQAEAEQEYGQALEQRSQYIAQLEQQLSEAREAAQKARQDYEAQEQSAQANLPRELRLRGDAEGADRRVAELEDELQNVRTKVMAPSPAEKALAEMTLYQKECHDAIVFTLQTIEMLTNEASRHDPNYVRQYAEKLIQFLGGVTLRHPILNAQVAAHPLPDENYDVMIPVSLPERRSIVGGGPAPMDGGGVGVVMPQLQLPQAEAQPPRTVRYIPPEDPHLAARFQAYLNGAVDRALFEAGRPNSSGIDRSRINFSWLQQQLPQLREQQILLEVYNNRAERYLNRVVAASEAAEMAERRDDLQDELDRRTEQLVGALGAIDQVQTEVLQKIKDKMTALRREKEEAVAARREAERQRQVAEQARERAEAARRRTLMEKEDAQSAAAAHAERQEAYWRGELQRAEAADQLKWNNASLDYEQQLATWEKTKTELKEAEEARQRAEDAHSEALKQKQAAEQAREKAEREKKAAEDAKTEALNQKQAAEKAREKAEREKKAAEDAKAKAEREKKTAEDARTKAEQDKKAAEDADQLKWNNASKDFEQQKAWWEKQFNDREAAWQEHLGKVEEVHTEALNQKQAAEQARERAEREKQAAEDAKAKAEREKKAAEDAHTEALNEVRRQAEAARVQRDAEWSTEVAKASEAWQKQLNDRDAAWQEHLGKKETEIRRLTTALEEVSGQLKKAKEEDIPLLKRTLQVIRSDLAQAQGKVRAGVTGLSEQTDVLQGQIRGFREDISTRDERIRDLNEDLNTKTDALRELRRQRFQTLLNLREMTGDTQTPPLNQDDTAENAAVQAYLRVLAQQLHTLGGQVSTLTDEKSSLQGQVTTLTGEKAQLEGQLTEANTTNQ